MDFEFGWQEIELSLYNIEMSNYIIYKKHEPDEAERTKYSESKRVLTANGLFNNKYYSNLYLGIPNKFNDISNLPKIENIKFILREEKKDELKYGSCGFINGEEILQKKMKYL